MRECVALAFAGGRAQSVVGQWPFGRGQPALHGFISIEPHVAFALVRLRDRPAMKAVVRAGADRRLHHA